MNTRQQSSPYRPLRRAGDDRMIAGVATGIAEHFNLDPTVVRVGVVALSLLGGAGIPLYLAAWLLIPDENSEGSIADDLLEHLGAR